MAAMGCCGRAAAAMMITAVTIDRAALRLSLTAPLLHATGGTLLPWIADAISTPDAGPGALTGRCSEHVTACFRSGGRLPPSVLSTRQAPAGVCSCACLWRSGRAPRGAALSVRRRSETVEASSWGAWAVSGHAQGPRGVGRHRAVRRTIAGPAQRAKSLLLRADQSYQAYHNKLILTSYSRLQHCNPRESSCRMKQWIGHGARNVGCTPRHGPCSTFAVPSHACHAVSMHIYAQCDVNCIIRGKPATHLSGARRGKLESGGNGQQDRGRCCPGQPLSCWLLSVPARCQRAGIPELQALVWGAPRASAAANEEGRETQKSKIALFSVWRTEEHALACVGCA